MLIASVLPGAPAARIVPALAKLPKASMVETVTAAVPVLVVSSVVASNVGPMTVPPVTSPTEESPAKFNRPFPRTSVFCESREFPSRIVPPLIRMPVSPGPGGPLGVQSKGSLPKDAMPDPTFQV